MNYQAYMNSRAWFAKRQQRLEIDDHRCRKCGHNDALQVHHLKYDNLGNEPMGDLVTLCDRCHGDEHEMQRYEKRLKADDIEMLRAKPITEDEYNACKLESKGQL
jgi:5-methylcytosine-specific restriction endonuclease McrA